MRLCRSKHLSLEDIAQITDRKRVMPLIVDMMQKGVVMIHQKLKKSLSLKKFAL